MKGPLIANRNVALWSGLVLFVAGAVLMRDAYEGRGIDTPLVLRPFTFW